MTQPSDAEVLFAPGDQSEAMDLQTLEVLARTAGPIGSARLAREWRAVGIALKQATAGRYLVDLEARGFVASAGPKTGRVITPAGLAQLEKLRRSVTFRLHSAKVVRAADALGLSELMEVLYARRGIETEAARLSARRASAAELQDISAQAESHAELVSAGRIPGAESSRSFHVAIVEASHNQMLISLIHLMIDGVRPELAAMLDEATAHSGAQVSQAKDHRRLIQALVKRDEMKAARAMEAHFTQMIATVNDYLFVIRSSDGDVPGSAREKVPARPVRLAGRGHEVGEPA